MVGWIVIQQERVGNLRSRAVSRRFSVRRQLFRAGTLDEAVLISNGFWCNARRIRPHCHRLPAAGSRAWVGFVLALPLDKRTGKGILLRETDGSNPSLSTSESMCELRAPVISKACYG